MFKHRDAETSLLLIDSLVSSIRRRAGAANPASEIEIKMPPPSGTTQGSLLDAAHDLERFKEAYALGRSLDESSLAALRENMASENGRRALVASIAWHVEQEVLEREQRWANRNSIFLGVAAFALTGIIGFLGYVAKNMVNERLDRHESETTRRIDAVAKDLREKATEVWIPSTVAANVDDLAATRLGGIVDAKLKGNYETSVAFLQLLNLALTLDVKDVFTPQQRDTVLGLLRAHAGKDGFRASAGFAEALERIVASFAAASQVAAVDEVLSLYPELCLGSYSIAFTMVEHYGRALVGSPLAPTSWPGVDVERFERVANAMHQLSQSDFARVVLFKYRLLVDARRHEADQWRSANGESIWRAMRNAAPRQDDPRPIMDPRVQFCASLLLSTDARYMAKHPDAENIETARVGSAMLDAYAVEFGRLLRDLQRDDKLEGVFQAILLHRKAEDPETTSGLLRAAKTRISAAITASNKADAN